VQANPKHDENPVAAMLSEVWRLQRSAYLQHPVPSADERRTDLQQRTKPPFYTSGACCWRDDPGQYLQERALAGAVKSDNSDVLAAPDLETRIAEGQKLAG